jgi:hypothetical protein
LIITSAADAASEDLAASWAPADVRCVRAADFCAPGWSHFVAAPGRSGSIAIAGSVIPEQEVTGVLTRTPWISGYELPQIDEADRDFVASEVSALLLSWLASRRCPVINRPMPSCLAGPPWGRLQWLAAAAAAGLRLPTVEIAKLGDAAVIVTVVGRECFGEAAPELRASSLRLAALAQVELLDVHFDRAEADASFAGVNLFPPLDDLGVRHALFALLQSRANRPTRLPNLRPWRAVEQSDQRASARISRFAIDSPIGRPEASSK